MGVQLILTHENTDFDALASQLAAWKLYPQAWPVLPRRPNRNLRDFLTFYWDELPYMRYEDLPRRMDVERIILVDTQTLITPKGMSDETVVQIIDHHPLSRELPPNWTYCGEEVGATVTLLLERIIAEGLLLTPVEATLLALGIYEDTGSLAYPMTTIRDLRCATWLVEHGANLGVVSDFLHHALTDQQLALYNDLLDSAEVIDFSGHTIVVATARAEGYVEEISTLAHKVRDLYDPAGLLLLVDLGEHLQLVARSTTDAVDVGHIAHHFGGGGHTRAAAALIRDGDLDTTRTALLDFLEQHIHPLDTVAQIMSHGVHTLTPDSTVDEAAEEMLKYGFEGFPIVAEPGPDPITPAKAEARTIVGILSRREIDRAQRLRLGQMPVSHYMTKGDIHVSPTDSVERLQQVMIEFGVGQVPVVDKGEILGIVTRTDLIKLWAGPSQPPPRRRDMEAKIEAALPAPLLDLLKQASDLAQEIGYPLYVVGGFVRDLLLGEPTLDMDLVVEGDAIKLARRLARRIKARTRSHKRFGTAKIILEGREAEFGVSFVDFATARLEFYPHTAALPEIERSSIKTDLHRRDFTINTLAIRLDPPHYGRLLNFYGGEQDLREGLIRVLHSLSFIEDPTRIMRAVRFEQRLGFEIETNTAELIDNALPMLSRVTGERIRHDLYLILAERQPERVLRRLTDLNVLACIHPDLTCTQECQERFGRLREVIAQGRWPSPQTRHRLGTCPALVPHLSRGTPLRKRYSAVSEPKGKRYSAGLSEGDRCQDEFENGRPSPSMMVSPSMVLSPGLYLALLTYPFSRAGIEALGESLKIFRQDLTLLRQVCDLREQQDALDQRELLNSEIDALLRYSSTSARLILWLCTDSERVRERLWLYESELQHVQPTVDGDYLVSLGLKPSPLFSKLLRAVRTALLDGEIRTTQEEKAFVARMLEAETGGKS